MTFMTRILIKLLKRRYMNSYKWKDLKAPDIDKDIYPMWVADMEFKSSPAIQRQMQERVEAGIFGYETLTPEYFKVISEWLKIDILIRWMQVKYYFVRIQ